MEALKASARHMEVVGGATGRAASRVHNTQQASARPMEGGKRCQKEGCTKSARSSIRLLLVPMEGARGARRRAAPRVHEANQASARPMEGARGVRRRAAPRVHKAEP